MEKSHVSILPKMDEGLKLMEKLVSVETEKFQSYLKWMRV